MAQEADNCQRSGQGCKCKQEASEAKSRQIVHESVVGAYAESHEKKQNDDGGHDKSAGQGGESCGAKEKSQQDADEHDSQGEHDVTFPAS